MTHVPQFAQQWIELFRRAHGLLNDHSAEKVPFYGTEGLSISQLRNVPKEKQRVDVEFPESTVLGSAHFAGFPEFINVLEK